MMKKDGVSRLFLFFCNETKRDDVGIVHYNVTENIMQGAMPAKTPTTKNI